MKEIRRRKTLSPSRMELILPDFIRIMAFWEDM